MSENDFVIFIQARLTSSRLPGKVLRVLGDTLVIHQVYARCAEVGRTVVLIPNNAANDELAVELKPIQAPYFRGAEFDVLHRFYEASKKYPAKNYVRITADCPLVSPDMIKLLLKIHTLTGKHYTSNTFPIRKCIKGMDVEVFTKEALERANLNATDPYDREHVTPWIQKNLSFTRIPSLALDTEEDYETLQRIVKS